MDSKFSYSYSAKQHAEVEEIRRKYLPEQQTDNKLEQLKKLDKSCEFPGTVISAAVGTAGTLIFGVGLTMILVWDFFGAGICIGILGLSIMAAALPIFRKITAVRRKQLAPEILRLSEEIEKSSV